jgi:hypothetical protein
VALAVCWSVSAPALAETNRNNGILTAIRRIADPGQRASLLLDAVEACSHAQNCAEKPGDLLAELAAGIRLIPERFRKVELLLRLASLEEQLGHVQEATTRRAEARQLAVAYEGPAKAALLLKLGLAEANQAASAESEELLAEAARRLDPASSSRPSFPFKSLPATVELGFAISGATFRDDTAIGAINADYYKQGERQDLELDLAAALSYDSSRSENTFRPNGLGILVFRRHLDARWNLFFDQLATVNNDTFSSRNDDNDISVVTASLLGAGMNLWRGEQPSSFIEIQVGAGIRYEYEELDSVELINEASPTLAVILRARELKLGKVSLNQTLSIGSLIDEWSNSFIWSTTTIQLPLTENWSWNNTFLVRYRTQPVASDDPRLNASFASGLTYTF